MMYNIFKVIFKFMENQQKYVPTDKDLEMMESVRKEAVVENEERAKRFETSQALRKQKENLERQIEEIDKKIADLE